MIVGAVLVAVAAGCLAFLAGTPAFSSGDEAAHVDYAFQVWHGQLPVFEDGLLLQTDVGQRPPVQWVAQHPPLFYLLIAPVVGPLVDAHHPVAAAMAARLITMLIAVAAAIAAVWATRQVLPQQCANARFVAPIVLACSPRFLRLGGAVYNDILLLLVFTCMLGLTAKMIRHGIGRFDYVWLSLIFACGALTRLAFFPLALACLGSLALAQLTHDRRDTRAWGVIGIPAVSAMAFSGWFYLRNVALTGSVSGGHPDWSALHMGRLHRSFSEVLSMPDFWRSLLWQFANSPEFLNQANVLLFAVPAACGVLFAFAYVLRLHGSKRHSATADVLLFGLILVCIVGVVGQQVLYVRTGGGVQARYFAMLLPLFAMAIAVGLTGVGRLGPWLVGAWLAMNAVDLFLDVRAVLGRVLKPPQADIYPAAAWTGFAIHVSALAVAFVFYVIWSEGPGSDVRKNREERLAANMATGAASTAQ